LLLLLSLLLFRALDYVVTIIIIIISRFSITITLITQRKVSTAKCTETS